MGKKATAMASWQKLNRTTATKRSAVGGMPLNMPNNKKGAMEADDYVEIMLK